MKYIIEIEDEPFVRLSALFGEEGLYRAKGFNSLVFDQFGLDKLTPLDKALDEAYQKGVHDGSLDVKERVEGAYQNGYEVGQHEATTLEYQQGLDDAWECAKKALHYNDYQREVVFGEDNFYKIMEEHSASRAIEKLKAYEEQQKADAEDSEIRVGDEVKNKNGNVRWTSVVVKIDGDTIYLMGDTGAVADYQRCNFKKTGRHFPQIEELLKAMKEGAE